MISSTTKADSSIVLAKINRSMLQERQSSVASTVKLNPELSNLETPPDRSQQQIDMQQNTQLHSEANMDTFLAKRANDTHTQKMPPLQQAHQQQSVEQMRLMREHKKIRDWFSKETEEKDGKNSALFGAGLLPQVSQNTFHHHIPNKVNKKAMSLISRHYQHKGNTDSLFSSDKNLIEQDYIDQNKPQPETKKSFKKVVLQKVRKDGGKFVKSSRYQTVEMNVQDHNALRNRQQEYSQEQESRTIQQFGGGLRSHTTLRTMQNTSMPVQKNTIDALIHSSSFLQANTSNQRSKSRLYQPNVNPNQESFQTHGGSQSIHKDPSYGSMIESNYKPNNEPAASQLQAVKSVESMGFDQNQIKLYEAVKKQQQEQSDQIHGEQLIPQDMSSSHMALQNTYNRAFVAKGIGPNGKRLNAANNKMSLYEQSVGSRSRDYLKRQASMPITLGRPDEDIKNLSNHERMSLSILLQDQYSSSGAQHAPGENNPLSTIQLYEESKPTKKQRMNSVLASLKLKRRTKFRAIPARNSTSLSNRGADASPSRFGQNQMITKMTDKKSRDREYSHQSEKGLKEALHAEPTTLVKFQMFRKNIQQSVEEQDYVSESQDSDDANEIHEDKPSDQDRMHDENLRNKCKKLLKDDPDLLFHIMRKKPSQRHSEEREFLIVQLIAQVPFFFTKSRELIQTLIDKLQCVEFAKRESLMDQGEIGDCMYIIMHGDCGIYVFNEEAKDEDPSYHCITILNKNTVVGENAVTDAFNDTIRGATVIAHSDMITLRLMKVDYQKILYQHQIMERQKRLEFLANMPYFKPWDRVSLVDFNNFAEDIQLAKGATIYDIGQDPSTIYVVKRGKLVMETVLEIDNYFRYPIDTKSWEVRKNTRQVCYKLQSLQVGMIFGHEEILQGFNRRCRVRCISDVSLAYIPGEKMKRWPAERIEFLRKNMRLLDLDHILAKIARYQMEKAKRNQAILDASRLNSHDFSGARSQFVMNNNYGKIQKLLPWINKCRQNATQNQNLLHELKKVTQLASSEEKYVIHRDDPKAVMPTDEFLKKQHARFVMPDETKKRNDQSQGYVQELNKKRSQKKVDKVIRNPPKRTRSIIQSTNLTRIKRNSIVGAAENWYPWQAEKKNEELLCPKVVVEQP